MVPEIVVTSVRLDPLARVRRALGGADARIPVEHDLMRMVEELLKEPERLSPSDRHFLEKLTGHKVPPLADPWDLAQVLYSALCLPRDAPSCRYEEVSGLCTATAEFEDLFLQKHIQRGMPALAMEELHPSYCEKSWAVADAGALEAARRCLALTRIVHPEEGPQLVQWRITEGALRQVLEATERPGVGLFVYRPA